MKVGDELAPLAIGAITKEQIAQYSRAANDPNPMHVDEELAQAAGYPTVFAQGMLGMAFLARYVEQLGGGPGCLRHIKVRFKTMTWPGEIVSCRARVTEIRDAEREQLVTCEIQTENERGEPKVVGTATYRV